MIFAAVVSGLCLLPARPAHADVKITINDGLVSIDAKDATVRQILAEWSRVGQTKIVNAERITGAPITLRLIQVPESQALDILLRSLSGYMAAPRSQPNPMASQFDRILVMPTSAAPRPATTAAAQSPQAFQPPPPLPQGDDVEMDDPSQVPPGTPVNRGPIFPQYPNPGNGGQNPFPARGPAFPQNGNNNPNAMPNGMPPMVQPNSPFPGGPGAVAAPGRGIGAPGVSTPGMMVAPPQPLPGQVPQEPQD